MTEPDTDRTTGDVAPDSTEEAAEIVENDPDLQKSAGPEEADPES